MKKLVISVLLASLLVGCASNKPKKSGDDAKGAPVSTAQNAPSSSSTSAADSTSADSTSMGDDELDNPNSPLAKRSFYYTYDQDSVQASDKPSIQAHAKYLADHSNRSVRLEGNADERGSNEYNLALGQRRADSVKQMLVLGGAKEAQIETSSYGEEKPKAMGHDEADWAQNRRTDLKYVK